MALPCIGSPKRRGGIHSFDCRRPGWATTRCDTDRKTPSGIAVTLYVPEQNGKPQSEIPQFPPPGMCQAFDMTETDSIDNVTALGASSMNMALPGVIGVVNRGEFEFRPDRAPYN